MEGDITGGEGWKIRGSDLRPEITDISAFREGLKHDPLAGALELLWTGHPDEAREALENFAKRQGPTVRVRALRADCLRDLGRPHEAVAIYDDLLHESLGTTRESFIRQHRGKALIAAERLNDAKAELNRVVEMRTGGDPALLMSAVQALDFVHRAMDSPR